MKHTDQEMLQTMLDMHKLNAIQLTNMAMECRNENLRRLVLASLDQTLKQQREIWQIMNNKGWHSLHQPSQDDWAKANSALQALGLS